MGTDITAIAEEIGNKNNNVDMIPALRIYLTAAERAGFEIRRKESVQIKTQRGDQIKVYIVDSTVSVYLDELTMNGHTEVKLAIGQGTWKNETDFRDYLAQIGEEVID